MKLTVFLLTVAFLHVGARGLSQTVTYSGDHVPLEKVFAIIKQQTGYVFFCDAAILKEARPVTIRAQGLPLQNFLDEVLKGQGLEYVIENKAIIISRKAAPVLPAGDTTVLPHSPGKMEVHGNVYNEFGQPLSGANITIKETGHGTITNAKGEFQLTEMPSNSTLIVSFIGYKPQSAKVKEGVPVQVYLAVAKDELDKAVVQAYGTTTQRFATGNITTVTAAQIERHPVMNVLEALQGQVPGMVVQQTSGYASAPFKIEIRGRSQIDPTRPSDPLYIIDGVPLTTLELGSATGGSGDYASGSTGTTQNGFNGPANGQSQFFSINPADIESVTVLKDADATAIYGSRGANGVIIFTTKKGRPGKTKFDLNVYTGVSKVTRHYDLMNTPQYLSMRREAFKNDGNTPTSGNAYDLLIWDTTRYTDWQKFFWGGMGKTTDVEASLSGGDKLTSFRVAGDYHHQTSILNYSGADQRSSVQFNLSHKSLDQRLNISFTGFYSYTSSDLISLAGSVTLAPNSPAIFDSQGQLNWAGWQPVSYNLSGFGNLFQPYTSKTGFLNSSLTLKYELVKGLIFSASMGYSTTHNSQLQIFPIFSQNPAYNPTGSSLFGNNNHTSTIAEPQIEYSGLIGKGKFNALVGGSVQTVSQDGNTIFGSGYVNDNLLRSVANAPTKDASDVSGQYKYAAVFSRITYNWENKYIINLSARRDGSSRFGPGKQFGNFGALGAAWIFTEERWFKNHLPFLSFGKFRGSYGLTGNDQITDYAFLTRWSASGVIPYQGVSSYVPIQHANPDLQWEVNKKLEGALNLGFLKDRISVEISVYRNRCGNQLVGYPLPIVTGFGQVTENTPATIQNMGWEVTLRTKLIEKKNFDWSFNMNVGVNHNKLIAFPNLSQSPYAGLFVIGQSLGIKKLLHYSGVDPQTGQYIFQDKNKDGQISIAPGPTDDRYFKIFDVKFDGGFGTDLRYKDVQLNLFFTFRKQLSQSAIFNGNPGNISENQSTQLLNHWQKPGDIAQFGRYTTQGPLSYTFFQQNSDGVYSDGSYIRLRSLSISYDMPAPWVRKAGMQAFKIYLRGENLFILSKFNGIDPDTPGLGVLPPQRIFTGGVQFNF